MPLGASFFEDVPLVGFMYLVFTRMPGGVAVGDSGLCRCVPCLMSVINSLCLFIVQQIALKWLSFMWFCVVVIVMICNNKRDNVTSYR